MVPGDLSMCFKNRFRTCDVWPGYKYEWRLITYSWLFNEALPGCGPNWPEGVTVLSWVRVSDLVRVSGCGLKCSSSRGPSVCGLKADVRVSVRVSVAVSVRQAACDR
eukprot:1556153-Rhodomonas_salina.1